MMIATRCHCCRDGTWYFFSRRKKPSFESGTIIMALCSRLLFFVFKDSPPKIMFKWWPPANCPENTCHKMFKLIFYCTGSLNEIAPNDVCTFLLLLNLFWNLEPWAFLRKQLPQLHHKGFCVWFTSCRRSWADLVIRISVLDVVRAPLHILSK